MTDETQDRETTHRPPAAGGAPEIRVNDLSPWLRRHGPLVLVLAILGGVATWTYASTTRAEVYRASAVLAVVPPRTSSDLLPSALTVQGYQELLESDAVRVETATRLAERGVLPEKGARLQPGQLRSTLFVSQRRQDTPLAPMIRLESRAGSADAAAALANTWAEVFLARIQDLMSDTVSITTRFVEEQYPRARDRLDALEERHLEQADAIARRRTDAIRRWEESLARARTETARLVNAHEAETSSLLSAFRARHRIQARRGEVEALQEVLAEHHRERSRVDARLATVESELTRLREQLAGTEPVLVLKRSLDETLVLDGAVEGRGAGGSLGELTLTEETENPLFQHLSIETARRETEAAALRPRAGQLADLIEREGDRLEELDERLTESEVGLGGLRAERSSGLEALREARSSVEALLLVERDAELAAIDRDRERRLGRLEREIDQERALFEELTARYNQAVLARGQEEVEAIRLAAPAVPPRTPVAAGGGKGAALGLFLGALLGLGLALVRDRVAGEPR